MYCPSCSSEQLQPNQYCRACGTDLRAVRSALERPDDITASAVTAREEIGRAIAARIHETESTSDLKRVAEDILPQIEKFLESPEEKRLRRLRAGVATSAVGLGLVVMFILVGMVVEKDALVGAGAGLLAFLIGLGLIINGLVFTTPRKSVPDHSLQGLDQRALDQWGAPAIQTVGLGQHENLPLRPSVTEHTTHRLGDKPLQMTSPGGKED